MKRCASETARIVFAAILLTAVSAAAVGWRGDGTGRFAEAAPPLRWSATRNVRWKVPLPSWGNASPIVVSDRVFVTAEPATLVAVNARTGKLLWQRSVDVLDALPKEEADRLRPQVAEAERADSELTKQLQEVSRLNRELRKQGAGAEAREKLASSVAKANELRLTVDRAARYRTRMTNDTIGLASSTPVSDGKTVFALFGNGVIAAYDLEGHRRWAKWLGPPLEGGMNGFVSGHAASPLLVDEKLVVPYGALRALDPKDGKELWSSLPYRDAGTPAVLQLGEGKALVTPEGLVIRLSDGKTLAEHLDQKFYDAPVVDGGTVFFAGAAEVADLLKHGHAQAHAIRLVPSADGVAAQTLWTGDLARDDYFGSPLVEGGFLYALSQGGSLSVLNAATGAQVYQQVLGTAHAIAYPSLSTAGGYLFASTDDGTTRVLRLGSTFEVVAENKLEPFRSSLFFAGRRLYVRGLENLYCIEETDSPR
jgi:outer membrane protein assembly factor BamB